MNLFPVRGAYGSPRRPVWILDSWISIVKPTRHNATHHAKPQLIISVLSYVFFHATVQTVQTVS